MNHAKKKRGVPDVMSGTLFRSVCGILCGQRKSAKPHRFQKLQKSKENTRNPKISGVVLECVDKKDAGALREFLRLLFSLILKYYNSCDLSTKIDKILNLFAG